MILFGIGCWTSRQQYHKIPPATAGSASPNRRAATALSASVPWHIYALVPINACGTAAILSIPITYMQDLIADRPGLGSSLISVNTFVANGLSAAIFATGTSFTSYSGTAQFAAAIGLVSIGLLLFLERNPRAARLPA